MFRPLRLSFFLIVLLLFFALFWDFNKGELRTTIQTGVCEEFDYANRSCQSGSNLIITSYPAMLIDPVVNGVGAYLLRIMVQGWGPF